jgi:acylphosphatase
MIVAKRFLIAGRVQGVGFRFFTEEHAAVEGVHGYVRNLPDGRVEAAFEGSDEAVERLVRWSRTGPEHARVDDVEVVVEAPAGDTTFRVAG